MYCRFCNTTLAKCRSSSKSKWHPIVLQPFSAMWLTLSVNQSRSWTILSTEKIYPLRPPKWSYKQQYKSIKRRGAVYVWHKWFPNTNFALFYGVINLSFVIVKHIYFVLCVLVLKLVAFITCFFRKASFWKILFFIFNLYRKYCPSVVQCSFTSLLVSVVLLHSHGAWPIARAHIQQIMLSRMNYLRDIN